MVREFNHKIAVKFRDEDCQYFRVSRRARIIKKNNFIFVKNGLRTVLMLPVEKLDYIIMQCSRIES